MKGFAGRRLGIATQHGKEQVIAPCLINSLGVKAFVIEGFDTDQLGTFSGEVERKNDPLTTLREKCRLAAELAKCDLVVASEGSFGPHPSMPYLKADDELVMLLDLQQGLEIVGRELSLETNFDQQMISTWEELKQFAEQVLFPSHALILKDPANELTGMIKGIRGWEQLKSAFDKIQSRSGRIKVETDMRAMHNPTRMLIIEKATQDLVSRVTSICPQCESPGYGIVKTEPGLPCRWCNQPTQSVKALIYECKQCHFLESKPNPNKEFEDPMYCDNCNP